MNTITAPIKQLEMWGDMTSHTVVVLISGKAQAGKTSLAKYLRTHVGTMEEVMLASFADKVKACARQFYMWDGKKDGKGRKLLQDIGGIGRVYSENLWVDFIIDNVQDQIFPPSFVIIDDWRFPNEINRLQEVPQFITIAVRVIRDGSGLPDVLGNDASEVSLTDDFTYDFFVHNDGTLLDLDAKAKDLANYIYSI